MTRTSTWLAVMLVSFHSDRLAGIGRICIHSFTSGDHVQGTMTRTNWFEWCVTLDNWGKKNVVIFVIVQREEMRRQKS